MDKREAILSRLFEILQLIPNQLGYDEHSTFRNRGILKEDKRPALVLLDGPEITRISGERRGSVLMRPVVVTLLPQIFVLLKARTTPSNEGIGEELNTFRAAIIQVVATDRILTDLCGPNGQVSLRRVENDLQTGRLLLGELRIDFAVDYVLDPSALVTEGTT